MLKAVSRFFLSMRTAVTLFILMSALSMAGSSSLVRNLSFFSGIDDAPLFEWLSASGGAWWIYAMISALAVLAVSIIFCTADALISRMSLGGLALKLSPQAMHMGVLFIMLGHLLTASYGLRSDVLLKEGATHSLSSGRSVRLDRVTAVEDENGYFTDWEAKVTLAGVTGETGKLLKPARPAYFAGTGLFLKSVTVVEERTALIRISRDPGAPWALAGGILLVLGGVLFIYGRAKG